MTRKTITPPLFPIKDLPRSGASQGMDVKAQQSYTDGLILRATLRVWTYDTCRSYPAQITILIDEGRKDPMAFADTLIDNLEEQHKFSFRPAAHEVMVGVVYETLCGFLQIGL